MYLRLRDLREDNDIKQQVLANLLFVHQTTYSAYEREEAVIPPESLDKLADFYGTSVDYLLGRTDVREPYPKSTRPRL